MAIRVNYLIRVIVHLHTNPLSKHPCSVWLPKIWISRKLFEDGKWRHCRHSRWRMRWLRAETFSLHVVKHGMIRYTHHAAGRSWQSRTTTSNSLAAALTTYIDGDQTLTAVVAGTGIQIYVGDLGGQHRTGHFFTVLTAVTTNTSNNSFL